MATHCGQGGVDFPSSALAAAYNVAISQARLQSASEALCSFHLTLARLDASPLCAATDGSLPAARAILCAHTLPGCCVIAATSCSTWARSDSLTAVDSGRWCAP